MKRRTAGFALVPVALIGIFALVAAAGGRSGTVQDSPMPALELAADAKELALTKGLAVGLIGRYGRFAVPTDLLAWQMATGALAAPRAGLVIGQNARGEDLAWKAVEAKTEGASEGWIEDRALAGGYGFFVVNSARARIMVLEATGYYVAWVNGEPRGGEKYGADWLRAPVWIRKGRNEILVRGERGRFKGRLYEPPSAIFFTDKDMTLPDLIVGEKGPAAGDSRRRRSRSGSRPWRPRPTMPGPSSARSTGAFSTSAWRRSSNRNEGARSPPSS